MSYRIVAAWLLSVTAAFGVGYYTQGCKRPSPGSGRTWESHIVLRVKRAGEVPGSTRDAEVGKYSIDEYVYEDKPAVEAARGKVYDALLSPK